MTTRNDRPATMSVEQAGELLGISRRSAYRAAAAGQLPTLRLGRRILVPTAALHRMLDITPPGHTPAVDPANPPDDHDQGQGGSDRRGQNI
jgi:excisionase family DNA binding protein